jgi:hypothetical protein
VKASEIALRKELAVTRLQIARAHLALARTPQRGTSMTTAISAVDLASSVLEQTAASKLGGRWTVYARLALRAAHVVLGLRGA